MFNKLSNKSLLIIFAGLLVIVLFIFFSGTGKTERTFREELVDIDTASVTEIKIFPKTKTHGDIRLFKEADKWYVELGEDKTAEVKADRINNIMNQLITIKPKRLAARDKNKWAGFQVDTSGTRVQVFEGGSNTLDIVLGKFSFQQPRSMSTFVRLYNDIDIYEVDGFLETTFNQAPNSFRDNKIIESQHTTWNRVVYDYPADSSFQLTKVNDKWMVDGAPADSAETDKFIRQLSRQFNGNFVDDPAPELVDNPTHKLTIETENDTIEVTGYQKEGSFLIHTSQNPHTYFDGAKQKLAEKIFAGKSKVLPKK